MGACHVEGSARSVRICVHARVLGADNRGGGGRCKSVAAVQFDGTSIAGAATVSVLAGSPVVALWQNAKCAKPFQSRIVRSAPPAFHAPSAGKLENAAWKPAGKGDGDDVLNNIPCLEQARKFYQYADVEGHRGSPHKLCGWSRQHDGVLFDEIERIGQFE
jgi:hypothetical protein